jgi:hypothetical protein
VHLVDFITESSFRVHDFALQGLPHSRRLCGGSGVELETMGTQVLRNFVSALRPQIAF